MHVAHVGGCNISWHCMAWPVEQLVWKEALLAEGLGVREATALWHQ